MKRIVSILLVLVTFLPLLCMSAGAESLSDLKKICDNLTTYLYHPYFVESTGYQEYCDEMNRLSTFINEEENKTQREINEHYNSIKNAYAYLMRNTFNYTELEKQYAVFQKLDSSLFTEESWEPLLVAAEEIQKELAAPTLFTRQDDTTFDEYYKAVQDYLLLYSRKFNKAYNNLEMLPITEEFTKSRLEDYCSYVSVSARSQLFEGTPEWRDFSDALAYAENTVAMRNPTNKRVYDAAMDLVAAYKGLLGTLTNTTISEVMTRHYVLKESMFSSGSWNRYKKTIDAVNDKLSDVYYFYLPDGGDKDSYLKMVNDYFKDLVTPAEEAFSNLITVELYNELKDLCNQYRTATSISGVEVKLQRLLTRVREGDELLADPDAVSSQIQKKINQIKSDVTNLRMAEGFLKDAQSQVVKQDGVTMRLILVLTLVSLALSLAAALYTSYQYFGFINWRD